MSALRKAGVWLGLVEEDDDRVDDGRFDDYFGDEEDETPPARTRTLSRPAPTPRSIDRESRGVDREPRSLDRDYRSARDQPAREQRPPEPRSRLETELRLAERVERAERPERPDRGEDYRSERASVRPLARPATTASIHFGDSNSKYGGEDQRTTSYPTHDNLALAPQVQLRERAVVSDESSRRYQITTLHLTTYSEARSIGEHFRDGNPVIMNLTEMDEADAKRLVDFAAGLAFGVRGSMERVTNRVFLLSPPNIQVSAEDKARIAEGGFLDRG